MIVGKAINISKRVRNHFTHNEPDRKGKFSPACCQRWFTACVNELEALVMERRDTRALATLQPGQKQPVNWLYLFEDNRGYMRLAIDHRKKKPPGCVSFQPLAWWG